MVKARMNERMNKILYLALSILLAIVLWLYVDDELGNTTQRPFTNIPIEFIGAEDTLPNRNLMLTGGADALVDLRLSGPRTDIFGMSRDDIRVQVDLSSISAAGTYTRSINIYYADDVDTSKINVDSQSRSAVTVQVSTMYSKTVDVNVEVVNNTLEDGYVYMSNLMTSSPSFLTLSGKEEDVSQVASALVTVDLSGAKATVRREFEYTLLDSDGNEVPTDNIRVSEKRIEVTAPIYITKELPLTVKFKSSPGSMEEDIRWSLSEDTITLAGEPASLENVSELLLAEIDLSMVLSNTDHKPMELEIPIPAGCENSSGFTSTKLTVQFRNMETKTFSVSNISAIGLSDAQSFSKVTNSVDVTLRGPADELDNVTEEDIRIVVDLTEFGSGTVRVPAIVLVDGHSNKVGAIGTYAVTCKISS